LKTVITKSKEETIKLAEKIARAAKPGDFIALIGELGAGKTTFVKGLAKGLGVKNPAYVNSPTFIIIKEYEAKMPLYHFDVYRFTSDDDLAAIGYEEYFFGKGLCVVEWADRIKKLLPKGHLEVTINMLKDNKRKIVIRDRK